MSHAIPSKHPFITNALYDLLKFLATIVFPAAGTAYHALAVIWGFPFGEQVVGTIFVIETAIGTVLLVTTARYNKSDARYDGSLTVDTASSTARLQVNEIDTVSEKNTLTLRVTAPTHTVE